MSTATIDPLADIVNSGYVNMLPVINVMLRGAMMKYMITNNLSYRKYAKQIGIPWHIVFAIGKGIVDITEVRLDIALKIMKFHNYQLEISMIDNTTKRVVV